MWASRRTRGPAAARPSRAALGELARIAREHGESLCKALSEQERQQLATLLSRIAEEQGLTPGVHPGFKRS